MAQARTNPWLVLLVLTTGFFMIMLDTTIVNVAIPAMSAGLNTTLDQILWVINAYVLVYAVLLITAGRLGDLFGQRTLFAIGLFIFTLASALCGFSQNPDQLIAARVLQGVGGALLTPQTLAILTTIFPPERRGAAFGIWGGVAGLATLAGPTLGGAIITYINWQWIFFINVPVGTLALIATFLIIPDLRPGRRHGWDIMGIVVATAGLFGIVFGLIEGERYNWGLIDSYGITIPQVIGIGVALIVWFVIWEGYQREPLMPLSLFKERNFAVANWISAAISFGMLSMFLPFTIYLQSARGFSALVAGLTLAPMSVVSMFTAPIAGRFADRVGGKYILMTGIALFTTGMTSMVYVAGPDSTWINFFVPAVIAGAGIGMTFAPLTTVAMRNIQPQVAGSASAVLNTIRQLGAVIGSAVIGAVLQNQLATSLHNQAVSHAGALPPSFQAPFIAAFTNISSKGFQIGTGQTGASLPSNLPPDVKARLAAVAHDVFVSGYIDAMKHTFVVPIAFLAFTLLTTTLIQRRSRSAAQQPVHAEEKEEVRVAAG
ncbi:MAG TPA: DHA2 family efflux MFS transporter permease subunit [Candidatus Dormibacteraeota bacterium]|nr:DHA2 family efflux MFS transporter permease subunit [Candidatus Dormibacteraeota bacterium]